MTGKVADRIQVWGFQDHHVIFGDSSVGVGFEFNPIQIDSWDDEKTNSLAQKIQSFLNGLPTNFEIYLLSA